MRVDRWCGNQVAHVRHYHPETSVSALTICPGYGGNKPEQPATVCVRLDGLADQIAAEIARHRWRTGIGRCECGKPVDAYMREHVAASLLALLQSLAVQ